MTETDLVGWVRRVVNGEVTPDDPALAALSPSDRADLVSLVEYVLSSRRSRESKQAQRRAMRLLRTFLDAEQQRTLRLERAFRAEGSCGGTYRLYPTLRRVEQLERHGSRWYAVRTFCLHEANALSLPPADTTLNQLLLLTADEALFLATANARELDRLLWNGGWLRQTRAARREREREVAA